MLKEFAFLESVLYIPSAWFLEAVSLGPFTFKWQSSIRAGLKIKVDLEACVTEQTRA